MTVTELESRRLLAAIYPTRTEQRLQTLADAAYNRSENGVYGWVGDRADDTRCWLQRRRAARGRHLIGRQR